jgi:hypothetical protein
MVHRADEAERRPEVLSVLRESLDLKKKVAKAWPDSKPWINETERELVSAKVRTAGLCAAWGWPGAARGAAQLNRGPAQLNTQSPPPPSRAAD